MFSVKGVSVSDAPFLLQLSLLVCLFFCSIAQATQAGNCAAERISERVQVIHVYDGDTVKLKDGRRLRFIGINTPETGHHERVEQPFARAATALLNKMLDKNNRILLLQAGREHKDHYGRMLAHVFLEDGSNIAVQLLQKGLATTLVVPPNTWGQRCYQQHEDFARIEGIGLWGLDSHKAKESISLAPNTRGFRIIRGQVQEVRKSRHTTRVSLEGSLVITINKKELVNFEPGFLEGLEGRRVETRGWIKSVRDGLQMRVKHPAALAVITTSSGNYPGTR
jgi:endonuclease YncB( thermonuclease family)